MKGVLFLISDILSVITISFCFILKVPQIFKLINAKEAGGISLNSLLLQLSSYSITMLYNYTNHHSLISYLEYPIIVIQEYIEIFLVLHYQKKNPTIFLSILTVSLLVMIAFTTGIISKIILTFLLPLTTPVGALSKIMQLSKIISSKNADSVSCLTWFLSCFTNVTRIYTVYLDSADLNLLLNFSISSLLSASVLFAAMFYQSKKISSD